MNKPTEKQEALWDALVRELKAQAMMKGLKATQSHPDVLQFETAKAILTIDRAAPEHVRCNLRQLASRDHGVRREIHIFPEEPCPYRLDLRQMYEQEVAESVLGPLIATMPKHGTD
jgi:hypothetical protein